ncbi:flagellar hook-basal body complex protein FliE [Microbulbifer sp.]|uniref:flagellar hook-basal body complex protein FliE n=1 Tax=Microbulbifer sp. TaxID=1908541 RepID=UPI003F2E1CEB
MSTPGIDRTLEQMKPLTREVVDSPGGNFQVEGGGFADALRGSLERINGLQSLSGEMSRAFQAGEPGVALHDVMIASQKAGIAFEMGVQVRNRLVNAYKDVMNMQI